MNWKMFFATFLLSMSFVAASYAGGPQLGEKAKGPMLDKSKDAALAALITGIAPKFQTLEYKENILLYHLVPNKNT